eukprot:6203168-Pleurochrysis_carterae.AAC.1
MSAYSAAGYSLGGYSVGGHSLSGFSLGGYSVGGQSVVGYSAGGQSVVGYSAGGYYRRVLHGRAFHKGLHLVADDVLPLLARRRAGDVLRAERSVARMLDLHRAAQLRRGRADGLLEALFTSAQAGTKGHVEIWWVGMSSTATGAAGERTEMCEERDEFVEAKDIGG